MSAPLNPPSVDPDYVPDPGRWRILTVLLVTVFMALLGVSIVNVVLPSIETGLGATQSDIQWVLSGYALTFGVVLVAAGRAGDVFGRGPIFIAGLLLFTLSSVAAGLAQDPATLNLIRFIQGSGAGLLNPQAIGMIQQYFRGEERARAFGLLGSVIGVSAAIGPLIGGLLVQLAGEENGWRWTFLVNVPVGVVATALAFLWFPKPMGTRTAPAAGLDARAGPAAAYQPRDLDPVGSVLLGAVVLVVLLPFVESREAPWLWALLPVGAAGLWLWVWWERRYKRIGRSPMVDPSLFRLSSFANGTAISGLYMMGMTSVWVLIALYLQDGLGRTALEAGLVGLPAAVLVAAGSNWAGGKVTAYGRRVVIWGIFSAFFGLVSSILVIQLHQHAGISIWWLLPALAFVGLAQGLVVSPNQTLTLAEVPLDYAGSAGAVQQTGQRVGTAVGIALVTAVSFAVLARSDWTAAITIGFAAIAVIVLATLAIALKDQRIRAGAGLR
ncbi:drug resistance efflux protein [Arthrobacter crystallopoietes BAB-32]|uniref:Drug resistance efflux protein n=1 Tax=Arthrobacter crystallopoietes BAB-32 TaxID=1246476 RepID=N1V1J7_9MICC|nr:MFS transporter [Arthrobacter crystallopoietes]EMY33864.1 drug resistance efflux protein [Arthrobacter crystallopoietes BAB-32]